LVKLKKPVSRLILLFILMVVVSGGILTFLSINNITNLRIITEKRIQETQLRIAGQISTQFQEKLNTITEEFGREVSANPAKLTFSDKQNSSFHPFLISKDGYFLYPFFVEPEQAMVQNSGTSIQPDFTNGEADEYQKEDFKNAVSHYLSALAKSQTPGDSAKVYNALGRVSVKLKQFDKAYSYYCSSLTDFNRELNPAGFPYCCLAISQILKLPLPTKQQEILILTEKFLEQLDRNEIPLTDGTKTILDELDGWFSTLKILEEQRNKIKILQENINSKLDFVSGYGSKISEITMSAKESELPKILGKYNVYAINNSDHPELLVLNKKQEQWAGFIIRLKSIWDSIANHLPVEKELEYIAVIVYGNTSLANKDELAVRAELSPYFPMHRMIIKPANEKLVEKYVRKRSWTYSIALVLMLGGMSLGIVLILRDIKREKEMTEMQSEFVAHVTHELKTPLTSINMFAETIFLDRAKSEELRKKYSNIIIKESEVLKRKIDNILEYSVRKNESTKYRMKETNLTALVGEVMEEMKYWLDINRFVVQTEFEADIFAHIDTEAIKQALTNLIGNAIKYSPVEKRLRVSLKKQAKQIAIEVEDSGMGIPKDQIDLIFEKFYRVRSIDSETTGTGLGLSVTRDIVKAHHGEILVVSEINKGSKFTILLNS